MKNTAFLTALFCAFIQFVCLGNSKDAFAMPQTLEAIEQQDIEGDTCPTTNNKIAEVSISLSGTDQSNLELARHMEKVMSHFGYEAGTTRSLYRAHLQTGVDFKLLVLKALMESDYGHFEVAANSSARGIFQYIESTWLVLMHRYGEKIGYKHYADAITYNEKAKTAELNGSAEHLRGEILALRFDEEVSALIKAHQIIEETDVIQSYKRGKAVTATDHYIAHMLGLYVMKDFYMLIDRRSPITPARYSSNPHMREAAATNRSFFFKGGAPITASQSYKIFEQRVEREFRKITQMKQAKLIEVSASLNDAAPCANETGAPQEAPETLKTVIR